jgi:ABC-type transport system involved in multi-copper enzyme maturation permease subunit
MSTDVTLARVTRSEWTKLWSLRSTRWSLLVACIAMAGLGPLIAAVSMAHWNQLGAFQRLTFNPLERSLAGYRLAQLAIGVLGVMVISGEYSTGMIRSSLLAVPRRLPVLWAKLLVFSGVALVLMLITSLISFFAAQAIFTQHHVNQTLSSPHALRVFVGTVLFMFVTGVLCTALGTIIRSTAGSISAYVALMFVLPGISDILPSSLSNTINPYLPSVAGTEPASTYAQAYTFSAWGGFALFCGYTVLAVAVAAYLLRRRDA